MQRLISLFKDPEEELDVLAGPPSSLPASGGQPLYFVQLLEYLREQRQNQEWPKDQCKDQAKNRQ